MDIYYVIKENMEALLVTNKDFHLKANAEKTKYKVYVWKCRTDPWNNTNNESYNNVTYFKNF
jgi:hypothetical protein